MHVLRRYAVGTALLSLASLWRAHCGYAGVDHRVSAADCAAQLPGAAVAACSATAPSLICLSPQAVRSLSPGWLARRLGDAGPLLVWLPLLAAARWRRAPGRPGVVAGGEVCSGSEGAHAGAGSGCSVGASLGAACLIWLASIMPVRYARRVLPFDPSGHVLLFGVQLVPLWAAAQAWHAAGGSEGSAGGGSGGSGGGSGSGGSGIVGGSGSGGSGIGGGGGSGSISIGGGGGSDSSGLGSGSGCGAAAGRGGRGVSVLALGAAATEALLSALCLATAAWHHDFGEVFAAWVLVGVLVFLTHGQLSAAPPPLRPWCAPALAAWGLGAALPLALASSSRQWEMLAGAAAHDAAVAVLAALVLKPLPRG